MNRQKFANAVWYVTQNFNHEWIIRQTQSGKEKTIGISARPRRRGTQNRYVTACELAASRNAQNGLPRASSYFGANHESLNPYKYSDLQATHWRIETVFEQEKQQRTRDEEARQRAEREAAQRNTQETVQQLFLENAAKRTVASEIIQATVENYATSTGLTFEQARNELLRALTRPGQAIRSSPASNEGQSA